MVPILLEIRQDPCLVHVREGRVRWHCRLKLKGTEGECGQNRTAAQQKLREAGSQLDKNAGTARICAHRMRTHISVAVCILAVLLHVLQLLVQRSIDRPAILPPRCLLSCRWDAISLRRSAHTLR